MKYRIVIGICLLGSCAFASAAQQYHEARSFAMGGTGVAGSHADSAPFLNPALLALDRPASAGNALLSASLNTEVENKEPRVDSFVVLERSFHFLEQAMENRDIDDIAQYGAELLADLRALHSQQAQDSAAFQISQGAGRVSMAAFSRLYLNAVAGQEGAGWSLASTSASTLETSDPGMLMLAGAIADHGLAISFPLSIVNMPVTVGLAPKLQRLESFHERLNANKLAVQEFNDNHYQLRESAVNLDLGLAIEPAEGLVLGLSGRNLMEQELQTLEVDGQLLSYRIEPRVTLGLAYDGSAFSVSSDIDLSRQRDDSALSGAQYWRLGAEVMASDSWALRLGFRTDLQHSAADAYSLGTGVAIGQSFKLDLTGIYGVDDALGAVLQTSYHF
jgi:hypothetical protein